MPYERQLKVRQVYKTLPLGAELMKSDVILKFRRMHPISLSVKDFFNGSNNKTVSGDYATPSSNGLHET